MLGPVRLHDLVRQRTAAVAPRRVAGDDAQAHAHRRAVRSGVGGSLVGHE